MRRIIKEDKDETYKSIIEKIDKKIEQNKNDPSKKGIEYFVRLSELKEIIRDLLNIPHNNDLIEEERNKNRVERVIADLIKNKHDEIRRITFRDPKRGYIRWVDVLEPPSLIGKYIILNKYNEEIKENFAKKIKTDKINSNWLNRYLKKAGFSEEEVHSIVKLSGSVMHRDKNIEDIKRKEIKNIEESKINNNSSSNNNSNNNNSDGSNSNNN